MAQRHDENYNEQPMTRMGRIQQPSRRYRRLRHPSFTAAIWTANNPLLQRGEFGAEIDTGKLKVGDGVTYWNDLSYVAASEIPFADITGDPYDNAALKDALDAKQDVLTAGTGIDIDSDNVISNSGVRSVASGTANGTISVNTNGTSADVAVTGLGSAAYTASSAYATSAQGAKADTAVQPADLATVATTGAFSDLTGKPTTLAGYGITDGANTDLSNLTSTGKNIGNWSSNVSNCITEIPQDIKLELSSGTLTLKAGSKVYKPNGAGSFSVETTTVDKTITNTTDGTYVVMIPNAGSNLSQRSIDRCVSGATRPLTTTYMAWYDTTNNVINNYASDASTPTTTLSFPLAIITVSGGAISSIDHVFNGLGYIGSTVFGLPGLKGLLPYGRKTDGTLNNRIANKSSVSIVSFSGSAELNTIRLAENGGIALGELTYNPVKNRNYGGNPPETRDYVNIGTISYASGAVTAFNPKYALHAVDYNDTEYIAHQAMPSDRYITLTLPEAPGGNLTAPADGYVVFSKRSGSANQILQLANVTSLIQSGMISTATSQDLYAYIPVSKGDTFSALYTVSGLTLVFHFVYANGVK